VLIAGGVVTSLGLFMLATTISHNKSVAGRREADPDYDDMGATANYYILTGSLLAVGVPMLAIGLFDRKEVYVRNKISRVALIPVANGAAQGGSVRIEF
jgi:hypothetical protein